MGDESTTIFGDSLTANSLLVTALNTYMPTKLFKAEGIGGQTWQQIMCRQGSRPIYVTVAGNAFTGATAVSITSISTQFLSTTADETTRKVSGQCSGRECIITRTSSGGVESYTIIAANSATTAVPPNSLFVPDSGGNSRWDIQILWPGRNNVPDLTGLLVATDSACAHIMPPRRFLVIGVLPALSEHSQSSGANLTAYNAIIAHNNTLRSTYPDSYVEITPPTSIEMTAINFTPTSQDLTDIANGVIPTSMRLDNVHINSDGYLLIALRVWQKYRALTWD
jgi:hypothetical protein